MTENICFLALLLTLCCRIYRKKLALTELKLSVFSVLSVYCAFFTDIILMLKMFILICVFLSAFL